MSIDGSHITAALDAGNVGDFVLDKAKKLIMDKTPEGLIEQFSDKVVVLNMDAIPELKAIFENVNINSLVFGENQVSLDANLK